MPNADRPTALAEDSWAPGQRVLEGEFTLLQTLGRGGFATVYLLETADHTKHREYRPLKFAAKRIRIPQPVFRPRLLREIQAWLDLPDHPHLAPYRFFRSERRFITIFSDYAPGGSVEARLAEGAPLALGELLDIALQALWGLDALHSAGFVHSDFKPANLLRYDQGVVRLGDFGLTIESADARQRGGLTLRYASPEQLLAKQLGPQSDLWSWATSVMEMWAGPELFREPNADAVVTALLADGTAPSRGTERLPRQLLAMLRRCRIRDASTREASARALAQELAHGYPAWVGRRLDRMIPDQPSKSRGDTPARITAWLEAQHQVLKTQEEISALVSASKSQSPPRPHIVDLLKGLAWQLLPFRVSETAPGIGRSTQAQLAHAVAMLEASRNVMHELLAQMAEDPAVSALVRRGPMNVRRAAAMNTTLLAAAYRELGDLGGAAHALDEQGELRAVTGSADQPYAPDPGNPVALYKEALLEHQKGFELHHVRRITESIAAYRRAIALLERAILLDDGTGANELGARLSFTRFSLAGAYLAAQDFAGALAELDLILTLQTAATRPPLRGNLELGAVFNERGLVLSRLGRLDEALVAFDQALDQVDREPDQAIPATKTFRARAWRNKAAVLDRLSRVPEAVAVMGKAVTLFEELARDHPSWENEHTLADALASTGQMHRKLKNFAAAIEAFAPALNIWHRLVEKDGHTELRGHHSALLTAMVFAVAELQVEKESRKNA